MVTILILTLVHLQFVWPVWKIALVVPLVLIVINALLITLGTLLHKVVSFLSNNALLALIIIIQAKHVNNAHLFFLIVLFARVVLFAHNVLIVNFL